MIRGPSYPHYFTKWVEVKPLANIRDMDAKKFVWKKIVTWFGVPRTLISDNSLQFDSKSFRRYYCDLGITNRYSIQAYPQGNGQVEAVNKVIVSGLKKRLDDAKGKWVEELPHIFWTYRTTSCESTGETPFSMTYGAEAVIPLETGFPMQRTNSFTPNSNDGLLEKSLNLIEEWRENAMVQLAYYQHKLKQGYDANVKLRPLALGDLVLRKVLGTTKKPSWGKTRTQLGGAISHHLSGWYKSIFSRRLRWACNTAPLECKQSEKVFLLMKVSFVIMFFWYIRVLYFPLFIFYKY